MIDRINILKIDVQGAELDVLRGASLLLASELIDLLCLEVIVSSTYEEQASIGAISSFFEERSYRLYDVDHLERVAGRLMQFDATFVSNSFAQGLGLV